MTSDVHEMLPYAVTQPEDVADPPDGSPRPSLDGILRATEARRHSRREKGGNDPAGREGLEGEGLVAECLDDRHPTLTGRVLVEWSTPDGDERERWVPVLQGLSIRVADRVLLMRPANFEEPVVTGVLDGFTQRPAPSREASASVEIKRDEAVRVCGEDGEELIEMYQGEAGPVVRLLQEDVDLELPGAFRLKASRIELEAARESVDVTARDDVNVDGEIINLNS
jgi:hypothetical protein